MWRFLACFVFALTAVTVYGVGVRSFPNNDRPGCPPITITANATLECQCVLPGQRCADPRSLCVKRGFVNICECESPNQPINGICATVPPAPLQCGVSAIAQLKRKTARRRRVQTKNGHKIVGGIEAIPNSWPWQVLVSPMGGVCGGTILDNEWVLTAAHCCKDRETGITFLPTEFVVTVAEHNVADDADGQEIAVVTVVPHPQYDFVTTASEDYDVCLLKLAQPVVYGTKIQPACLATANSALEAAGATCYITGWGTIAAGGELPDVLLQASTTITDQGVCNTAYDGDITDQMICAAAPGIDSCQGDSGGPLICQDPTTQAWTLVGVTSFGIGCADPDFPGVYVRVSTVLDFITATIG